MVLFNLLYCKDILVLLESKKLFCILEINCEKRFFKVKFVTWFTWRQKFLILLSTSLKIYKYEKPDQNLLQSHTEIDTTTCYLPAF